MPKSSPEPVSNIQQQQRRTTTEVHKIHWKNQEGKSNTLFENENNRSSNNNTTTTTMRRKHHDRGEKVPLVVIDDADAAAGKLSSSTSSSTGAGGSTTVSLTTPTKTKTVTTMLPTPPSSRGGMSMTSVSDLEFFEDLVSEPVLVLGVDISHLSRRTQFLLCASGVFFFSLLYGYLQELLSVQLCNRQLGLFLAMAQFCGYTLLSYIIRTYVYQSTQTNRKSLTPHHYHHSSLSKQLQVPFRLYLGLSLLRAVDLCMTNLAMQYINYPAKTLMKSSRVVFTMIFGVLIAKKVYRFMDYFVVLCMVFGLAIFMHADANSSAVFQPLGVGMLTISLLCDGAITNMSESIMNQFGVGQDEFIFRMYSIALIAISVTATTKGDLREGLIWMLQPGTYAEQQSNVPLDERTWTSFSKIMVMILFSSMGFFGSSCSAAITKNFGALTMSITSTARKATTLFLSFLLFDNECTKEHIVGILIFISALTTKSLRRSKKRRRSDSRKRVYRKQSSLSLTPDRGGGKLNNNNDVEMGGTTTATTGGSIVIDRQRKWSAQSSTSFDSNDDSVVNMQSQRNDEGGTTGVPKRSTAVWDV